MSSYVHIIKISFVVFPFLALLITLPYFLIQYRKYGSVSKLRIIIVYTFILYLLNAYFLVILPLPKISDVALFKTPRMQLIPFNFVSAFLKNSPFIITKLSTYIPAIKSPYFYQVAFNFIFFIPFGMYLRYYFKNNLKSTILLSFGLSLFFELTQLSGLYGIYPRGYRLFDVDDLMINTLGGVFGYFLVKPFMKILPSREKIDEKSYKNGNHISSLRRLFAAFIDYSIYYGLVVVLNNYINSRIISLTVILLIYFILIPTIFRGYTLGKYVLRFKIIGINKINVLNYLVRYFIIFITIILIPYYLEMGKKILIKMNYNSVKVSFFLFCAVCAYIFLYGIVFVIKTHKEKQMIYEILSRTKQISTVKQI